MVRLANVGRDALSRTPPPQHRCCGPLSARAGLGEHGHREALGELARLEKEPLGPLPGLSNLGNTCFINAVLQCLLNAPGFPQAIESFAAAARLAAARGGLDDTGGGADGATGADLSGALLLSWRFARLAAEYAGTEAMALAGERGGSLARFRDALSDLDEKYEACEQQDAFEFLGCLLEGLDDGFRALLRSFSCPMPQGGVVRRICGVTTYSTRRCLRCQGRFQVDKTTDTTLGLPLVSQAAQADEELRLQEEARPISLLELLEAAQQPEEIAGYDCDRCRAMANAAGVPHSRSSMVQQSTLVCGTRGVLIVALYRFLNTFDANGCFAPVKLRRAVALPTRLHLASTEYRLNGVVSHCGTDLSSGHYIAAVRSTRDGIWYECDDSRVRPLRVRALYEDDSEVIGTRPGADPFILFYHRVGAEMELVD